jgi:hypothetical protein
MESAEQCAKRAELALASGAKGEATGVVATRNSMMGADLRIEFQLVRAKL